MGRIPLRTLLIMHTRPAYANAKFAQDKLLYMCIFSTQELKKRTSPEKYVFSHPGIKTRLPDNSFVCQSRARLFSTLNASKRTYNQHLISQSRS